MFRFSHPPPIRSSCLPASYFTLWKEAGIASQNSLAALSPSQMSLPQMSELK